MITDYRKKELSTQLDLQVKEYLKKGGIIQQIPRGMTAEEFNSPKDFARHGFLDRQLAKKKQEEPE